jgi:hypothetical protein
MRNETRFRMVEQIDPERFARLARAAQDAARRRIAVYEHMAAMRLPNGKAENGIDERPAKAAAQPAGV